MPNIKLHVRFSWLLAPVVALAISTTAKAGLLAYDMFSGVASGDVPLTGQNYSSPDVSGFNGAWSVASTAAYKTATNFNTSIPDVGLGAGTQQGGIWTNSFGTGWNKSYYATRQLAASAYVNLNSNNTYYYSFYGLSPDDNAITVGFSTGSATSDNYVGVGLTWDNATQKGTSEPNLGNNFVINVGTLDGSTDNGVYGINAAGMKSGLNDNTAAVNASIFYVAVVYASATGNDVIKMTGYNAANPVNGQVWTAEYSFTSSDTFTHLLIGMTGGDNTMNIDGFRLGTSFADVVPEPASMTLLTMGIFFLARRRKP